MSNVTELFPQHSVTVYRVIDPGLTWYEQDQTVCEIQLKNDAAHYNIPVEDILDEMHIITV